MTYTRRQFAKLSAATVAGTAALTTFQAWLRAQAKPDSHFHGVWIGVISAYSYHGMPGDAVSILKDIVQDGISGTEMENTQETYAGAPTPPPYRQQRTPEEQKDYDAYQDKLLRWRLAQSMDKFVELRKMYNDAGVAIYGFKITLTNAMPDAAFDYAFKAAKACGATQLTMELPEDSALTARMGKFGEEHQMMVGYHAHLQAKPDTWDNAMSQSKWNGINLDIGHYVAAGNHDALDFIRKNHARITSMHLKDRRYPENGGKNMPFGEGDTPIKGALQLVRDQGYKFPCTIELEYPIPAGSDAVKEIAKCVDYCKAALA